jgi:uncharacterized membrane protein YphA (DoxX/SURF4 family)
VNLVDSRAVPSRSVPHALPLPAWPLAQRIGFRFVFAYCFVYIFAFPLGLIPWLSGALAAYGRVWNALAGWVATHLLHLPGLSWTGEGNGSGDTTEDYVMTLVQLGVALLVTVLWSVLDRRRRDYRRLFDWLHLYVRWFLFFFMLTYGLMKVIKTQFPLPGPDRLLQPYGESSPMGLLWTFMGQSTAYTIFAGSLEVLGGLLLIFRRTATLGALVAAAVMTNVVMLNLCYDVPVKLFSSHLLLMAVLLAAPELARLFRVLVLHRGVEPSVPRGPTFARRWQRIAVAVLKVGFVGYAGFTMVTGRLEGYARGDGAPDPPHFGVWEVESFVENGKTLPPLTTDPIRWQRVIINRRGRLNLRRMNGARVSYKLDADASRQTLTLTAYPLAAPVTLTLTELADDQIELSGPIDDAYVTARLRKMDDSKQLLMTRGFHWINEAPFNR